MQYNWQNNNINCRFSPVDSCFICLLESDPFFINHHKFLEIALAGAVREISWSQDKSISAQDALEIAIQLTQK